MADPQQELDRLVREALRFHALSQQLALEFDRDVADIWKAWARIVDDLLQPRATGPAGVTGGLQLRVGQVLSLRAPLREALARAGYDATATAGVSAAVQRWLELLGPSVPVGSLTQTIGALQHLAVRDLLNQGDIAANLLWRALAQRVMTPRSHRDILRDLAKVLDRSEAQARTLFDTTMTMFGRQIEALSTDALGDAQPFLYAGPVDIKTRDWCLDRVGKVYTREEIDAMENGQLPNAFLTGGGYNCRHVWMAVESSGLRALQGTGRRADGFQDDVDRITARKRAA